MAKSKTQEFQLAVMPLPKGRFTREKAKRWLEERLLGYTDLATWVQARDGNRELPGICLLEDIHSMSRACGAVLAGERVKFSRAEHNEGATESLEILTYCDAGEDIFGAPRETCAEIARAGLEIAREQMRQHIDQHTALERRHCQLEDEIEVLRAQRDRYKEYHDAMGETVLKAVETERVEQSKMEKWGEREDAAMLEARRDTPRRRTLGLDRNPTTGAAQQ